MAITHAAFVRLAAGRRSHARTSPCALPKSTKWCPDLQIHAMHLTASAILLRSFEQQKRTLLLLPLVENPFSRKEANAEKIFTPSAALECPKSLQNTVGALL